LPTVLIHTDRLTTDVERNWA